MRYWVKEVEPTLAYARHRELDEGARIWLLEGQSGRDVVIECSPDTFESIEITGTYTYQDRLTDEQLNSSGWAAPTTEKRRNRLTGAVECVEEDSMVSAEDVLTAWARRIETSLRKKQRPNYGIGSTLLVSCRGLSGDMNYLKRSMQDVLRLVPENAKSNGFNRTLIMSWHKGWLTQL